MITAAQRATIDAVVSVLETGKLPSPAAYGTVAILADGAGLSYGKHQATAASTLPALLAEYDRRNGLYAGRIRPYLPLLASTCSLTSESQASEAVQILIAVLRAAGADPVMQQVQDDLFDREYWIPATTYASNIGLCTALSHLCVYDLAIQSGPTRIDKLRPMFPAAPPSRGGDEAEWTRQLVRARREWLAGHPTEAVRRSVYRCDQLLGLITAGKWHLTRPFVVLGVRIA